MKLLEFSSEIKIFPEMSYDEFMDDGGLKNGLVIFRKMVLFW
jgi:hypothetical protein